MKKIIHDNGCVVCFVFDSKKWHNSPDGPTCDHCHNKIRNKKRNQEIEVKEYQKKYRQDHPEMRMWSNIKYDAKMRGIPFNIEIIDIVIPEVCPIFGIPLIKGIDYANDNSPSLDRVIPSLGYIKGNVQVISMKANTKKSDLSIEDLEAIIAYIKRNKS